MSQIGATAPPLTALETTLLVVDDHSGGRYAKTHALAKAGFRVIEATTGKEALRKVAEHRPALIVLDIKLPDIDGISVCNAIRENPATADTIVLQISAYYTSTEDQVHGLDSGADAYVPGDIAPALLVAYVRALLRTHRAEAALRAYEERAQLLEALDASHNELRALTAALLTAQEEERARIARDLHDDFSQRLALLEVQLTRFRHRPAELDEHLDSVIGQISAISEDLRSLSHGLHTTGLEHLGLETCLQNLCEEFERTYNLRIECICSTDGRALPLPTATVLYRIAQEALRNVAKHAGDARVVIRLVGSKEDVCLRLQDDGCGFDPGIRNHEAGLGLVSMKERARLIGGRIEVDSAPGKGTTVTAWAPWSFAV